MAAPRLKVSETKSSGHERRSIPRVDIRQSDGVSCRVCAEGEVLFVGRPYDISMNSIALILPDNHLEMFLRHEKFEFVLEIPDHGEFTFLAKFVSVRRKGEGTSKVAFAFEKPWSAGEEKSEVVEAGEFNFPPNFAINCYVYKPNFFYERSFVKLLGIGQRQVRFQLFDFETLLFPGMKIDLYLFDPSAQLPPLKVRVDEFQRNEATLEVKASIQHFPKKLSERLAQTLIFDFQLSIEAVKRLGMAVPKISDGLRFRFVKTNEEYEDVLKLRLKAYQLAGKVADGKTHQDMAAPLDHISRIIAAYHGNKIVSSIAISFPDSNDLVLDTERAFEGGYPKRVPPKVDCVEIARLCTDPEYRGSDLLLRMFEHTYKTLQCGGRKFIITSTDHKLWPLYKKLGFKKTGMKYPHPYLSGLVHDVIIVPVERAQNASGIDPLRWNYLYRDMNDHLRRRGVIRHGRLQRIWISAFKWVGKILKIRTKQTF